MQKTIQSLTEHILVVNPDSSEALVGYIKVRAEYGTHHTDPAHAAFECCHA